VRFYDPVDIAIRFPTTGIIGNGRCGGDRLLRSELEDWKA
jgi:hypothetical protein